MTNSNTAFDEHRVAYFPFSFPFSNEAWARYRVDELLEGKPTLEGESRFSALRTLAARMNHDVTDPTVMVSAGQLSTLALLKGILRHILDLYLFQQQPETMPQALQWAREKIEETDIQRSQKGFVDLFSPQVVHFKPDLARGYLSGQTAGRPNQYIVVREMILLFLCSVNPALKPFKKVLDDEPLRKKARYERLMQSLEEFFADQPPMGRFGKTLFRVLRAPIEASPESLDGQMGYILDEWGSMLPPELVTALLQARDILREEWMGRGPVGGGPAPVLTFGFTDEWKYPEPERFSQDVDWMSNVVMIAKSTYVWLDQLSKKYGREIHRLDQIPDEELDLLARWGFSALWLIGIWERSSASRRIKQIMGNPEAMASAYSLYDYTISQDLGGDAAYENLRERAWRRGIRLAGDMVPNHVGLYSKWVIEHPDWFIQLRHPPYPAYNYAGESLSEDDRVGLYIEDGYWSHTDAAVVFKRVDHYTGDERFIYHGNDGTHMPWNDTAQLDYLNPEVREAVIQTILHVARKFPIIRFDAAMTLSKKHYQRLWFPRPGEGGAIPSRAEHGMSRAEFDERMPEEFWREVVERVGREVPDTLLLAEAFWLMEGYFVRSLGMHRVYNSAFMNMLKMEENAKYRETLKNVLEFSPRILKRFVNFMNNPDERTAVEQFGKDEKYYGVAMLMATLPGLPMFGHGQIEGFTERYGMEYRRAYFQEEPDQHMVWRHEQEIFPLLRRRYLFSGARNFALYDFHTPDGHVDENVLAFTNMSGGERAVVVYNNSFHQTSGYIHTSTRINRGQPEEPVYIQKPLTEALDMRTDERDFYLFRDVKENLEYLRPAREFVDHGLYVQLSGYQYHVFLDFRHVYDHDGSWRHLHEHLGGRGVPSVDQEQWRLKLQPMHNAFRAAFNADTLKELADPLVVESGTSKAWKRFEGGMITTGSWAREFLTLKQDMDAVVASVWSDLTLFERFEILIQEMETSSACGELFQRFVSSKCKKKKTTTEDNSSTAVAWIVLHNMGRAFYAESQDGLKQDWIDRWLFDEPIREAFHALSDDPQSAEEKLLLLRVLLEDFDDTLLVGSGAGKGKALQELFQIPSAQSLLGVNYCNDTWWFSKEQFEKTVDWLFFVSSFKQLALLKDSPIRKAERLEERHKARTQLLKMATEAEFQVHRFVQLAGDESLDKKERVKEKGENLQTVVDQPGRSKASAAASEKPIADKGKKDLQ